MDAPPPSYTSVLSEKDAGSNPDHQDGPLPPLHEIERMLRTEMGLTHAEFPTTDAAITEACRQLKVQKSGGLLEKAQACYIVVFGDPGRTITITAQPRGDGRNLAPAQITQSPPPSDQPQSEERPVGWISTQELEGPYVCLCFPTMFCSTFEKQAVNNNTLRHAGCCYLVLSPCIPFEEHRDRVGSSNGFRKRDGGVDSGDDVDQNCLNDAGRPMTCNGLSCSTKLPCFPAQNQVERILTPEISGCWFCCCFPFCALFKKHAVGTDTLLHKGVCFLGPVPLCPFSEHRDRSPTRPNSFFKRGEAKNLDTYSDAGHAYNGASISLRICK